MNLLHLVCFGAGRARRYLAQADAPAADAKGWRPLVWTADIARAEKFASPENARAFARDRLPHALWDVCAAPPRGLPTDDLGGSPAAMRAAA